MVLSGVPTEEPIQRFAARLKPGDIISDGGITPSTMLCGGQTS
jgi:hypothetical protein